VNAHRESAADDRHADLLVGVVVDEAKCSDDAGMVNGEAVCAAPFTGQDCVVCPRTVRAEVIAVAVSRWDRPAIAVSNAM